MTENGGATAVRLGIQLNNWQRELDLRTTSWDKLDAALGQVVEAGFAGAEVPNWSVPDLKEPARLRDLFARHGAALISMHYGGPFYDAERYRTDLLPRGRLVAECAAAAGAEALVVSGAAKRFQGEPPGLREGKVPDEWRIQAENLADFARVLRGLGLRTWYHNHNQQFEYDAAEMESILQAPADLIGLCVDVGHAAQAMAQDRLLAWLARRWDRIGCLHYKDVDAEGKIVEAVGDGVIDWAAIGRLARERHFVGWAVAELDSGRGGAPSRTPLEDARRSHALMARTLQP